MRIEINPLDVLSRKIYDAHMNGANFRKNNSTPCTICRAIVASEDNIRGHFHGSEFGQCMLKTYRDMIEGRVIEPDRKAAFLLDGHMHEAEIFKNLEAGGLDVIGFANADKFQKLVEVFARPDKDNNGRFDFTMPSEFKYTNDGKKIKPEDFEEAFKIILHLDGLLEVEKDGELVGIECKSVSDYTWKKIKDKAEISDVWYGQMQSYMLWNHNIRSFYLIVKHRGTSTILKPIKIDRDDKYINDRLNRLYRVFNAVVEDDMETYNIVKEHNDGKDSECRFCPYKSDCFKLSLNPKKKGKISEDEELAFYNQEE